MKPSFPATVAVAILNLSICGVGRAADVGELEQIRAQIAQIKAQYEARIAALEQRLASAESSAPDRRPLPVASSGATATGFNPELSLVLGGALTRQSRDPADWRIGGFVPGGEPGELGPPTRRGYSLQESELGFAANIDPNFRGTLTFALSPENTVEVEEAFVQSLAWPVGLGGRVGRFPSGIGYQNGQHPHAWDFADAPLAYTAFFGGHLTTEGAQIRWLAPTATFLEFGVEAGRDDGFPGSARNKGGSALGAVFAHVGGDAGATASWRAGLSLVGTRPRERSYDDVDALGIPTTNAFTGKSRTLVADAVWKWSPAGEVGERSLKLAGEYFRRRETGSLSCESEVASGGNCEGGFSDAYRSRQSGFYAQAVAQFSRGWRVGYRYDRLDSGSTSIGLAEHGVVGFNAVPLSSGDFGALAAHRPRRHSLMTDWNPSEFSRIRLQVARDFARPGAADHQVWLQYIMTLGAHAAHAY